jgi:hypothetical protein
LRAAGTVVDGIEISERKGHYTRGYVVDGDPNWSRAVFASPVLTYAAHPCYAARVCSKQGTGQWCILIQVYIRPNKFTTHSSTVRGKYVKPDGSEEEEMRVEPGEDEKIVGLQQSDVEVVRVPDQANVVVAAVLLENDQFIQNIDLSPDKLSELMQGSDACLEA